MTNVIKYRWLTPSGFTRPFIDDLNLLMLQLTDRDYSLRHGDLRRILREGGHAVAAIASDPKVEGGSVLAGVAMLVEVRTFSDYSARIENVIVSEEYRGRGIRETLVKMLIARAGRLGLHHVELTGRPSLEADDELYSGLGFEGRATNVYRLVIDGNAQAASEPVTRPDIPSLRESSVYGVTRSNPPKRHGIDLDEIEEVFDPTRI